MRGRGRIPRDPLGLDVRASAAIIPGATRNHVGRIGVIAERTPRKPPKPAIRGTRTTPARARATKATTIEARSFPITFSIDNVTLDALDAYASSIGATRSFAIRLLINGANHAA